ncbi:MAG: substrate-binding domain-containing protein [Oscillospiraceae bacterium]|nr:substrate-binding domain-containing protein [Oscillospiraceae bacterium]
MRKCTWKRLTALLLLLVMLCGCTYSGGKNADPAPAPSPAPSQDTAPAISASVESGTSGEGKTIGFSIASLAGTPYWQAMLDRLKAGFEAKGYEVVYTDAAGDVSTQLADIQTFISMNVDALLINPYASDSVADVSLQAEKAGIPVFAVDIPISDTGYSIATFICDNWSIGKEHGRRVGALFPQGETVDIIILSGFAGGEDSWDRRLGFVTGIADYQIENGSSTNFNILYQSYCNYEQEMAYERMVDIITRFDGDFDVVYCENDAMALGAITALEEAGRNPADYIILGIDGMRQGYEKVKEGKLYGDGVNSPVDVADLSVEKIDAYLSGDTTISGTYYTEFDIVTKDNVDSYYDPNSLY